jgi:hypothetical protein
MTTPDAAPNVVPDDSVPDGPMSEDGLSSVDVIDPTTQSDAPGPYVAGQDPEPAAPAAPAPAPVEPAPPVDPTPPAEPTPDEATP